MKGQSLVVQFLLFFLIGLALFITISGFFRAQSDIFREDIVELNRKLAGSYISYLSVAMSSCKECGSISSTFKLKNTTANYIFEFILSASGLKVSSLPGGGDNLINMHNLQDTFTLMGTASSFRDMILKFDRSQNSFEIANINPPPI